MKRLFVAPVVLGLVALGGCAVEQQQPTSQKMQTKSKAPGGTFKYTPSPTPEPAAEPSPDGTYTSSCSYVLGDFTEYSQGGFRFIADAKMHNTGNVGTVNEVKVVWYMAGGDKVIKTKRVKMVPNQIKRVGFSIPVSGDQIDRYQATSTGDDCKVTSTMVDTFGEPQT